MLVIHLPWHISTDVAIVDKQVSIHKARVIGRKAQPWNEAKYVFSELTVACSPPSQLQGNHRGLPQSVHSSYSSPDVGSSALLDSLLSVPNTESSSIAHNSGRATSRDGNCMCRVGKVQRIFIFGQLKVIPLFRIPRFIPTPLIMYYGKSVLLS